MSSRSTNGATPPSRCSQLSSTTSASAVANLATTVSVGDRPGCSPNPKALATAAPTMAASVTGTRSTYQAPSTYWSARSDTTARASRVLPTPPGPTAVTSRCRASSPASAARSAARPTNDVSGDGSDGAVASGAATVAGPEAQLGQRPAVGHVELAQQRRHVALDGPHRDDQAPGDLLVGQVLAHERQHLGLTLGDRRPDQQFGLSHGGARGLWPRRAAPAGRAAVRRGAPEARTRVPSPR